MRIGGPKDAGKVQSTQGEPSLADLRALGTQLLETVQSGQIDVSHLIGVQREAMAPLAGPIQRAAAQALDRRGDG